MKKAVLFLIFNRPETTKKVFEAIRVAKPPRLYIASDAARTDREGEAEEVIKTRKIVLDNIDWKCEIKTLFRDKNLGCRKSVSSAVTWFFKQEKDGIILEDDVLPNKSFFKFCEKLLDRYADNKKVMHIAGHRFAPNFIDNSTYYFAKIQHCWGWASWADRWQYYGTDLANYDEKNLKKFSSNLSVQAYWKNILGKMQNNEIDSWAYQWVFRVVERGGLCINPSENLVSNIGFSKKGTHTINKDDQFANLSAYEIKEIIYPQKIELDEKAVNYIYQDHYGINFLQTEFDSKNIELNKTRTDLDSIKDILINTKSQLNIITSELDITKLQLVSKNTELNKTGIELDSTKSQLNAITSELCITKSKLISKNTELNKTIIELDSTKSQLTAIISELGVIKSQLNLKEGELDSRTNELNTIYYSRGWRFLMYIRKALNFIIPKESIRRKLVSFSYNFSKKNVKFVLKIKSKIIGLFLKGKNYFLKLKSQKREENRKSNKLIYVGHSYQAKTKSTGFLIDYLKESYEVEVVLDESWQGKPFVDLSFIDDSYSGVVFFQNFPSPQVLESINNKNIIFIPMYDSYDNYGPSSFEFWDKYKNLKIINFSKTLHQKLVSWDFNCIYVQFFPKPLPFIKSLKRKVFFWQRISKIDINLIEKLLGNLKTQIHVLEDVDPCNQFTKPSLFQEKKYQISYSNFEPREQMQERIQECDVYIAPREFEGIGLSYLEAMAMGKAVIAVDNPTMNEYITNGVNGYLFDLKNPKELDLSNVEQIRENCYEFIEKGYQKWEKDKHQIIDFIKSKPPEKRKINRKSNKLVYVGHSYHNKTKSTSFLIDYLKESYEVEVIWDESWLGKPFVDLSFVDESYFGVVFFQLLPPKDIIQKIRNNNIICFPMYDHLARVELGDWDDYRNFKIINFSKTLHDKLIEWGFESIYTQYFPEVDKFTPGDKKEIFFWQRITHLNINTVAKLFKNNNYKIHLHKTIGPGQEFIQPSKKIEEKFQITYSDWFEDKSEMLDIIKQKGIYVAPREFEGIGMSFLEAMAMGKAVIAVDNPTMNEYIINGVNGYLFDLKNPKELDLSNVEQIQKNCYEYMKKGHKEWEKDKQTIIDFIKK